MGLSEKALWLWAELHDDGDALSDREKLGEWMGGEDTPWTAEEIDEAVKELRAAKVLMPDSDKLIDEAHPAGSVAKYDEKLGAVVKFSHEVFWSKPPELDEPVKLSVALMDVEKYALDSACAALRAVACPDEPYEVEDWEDDDEDDDDEDDEQPAYGLDEVMAEVAVGEIRRRFPEIKDDDPILDQIRRGAMPDDPDDDSPEARAGRVLNAVGVGDLEPGESPEQIDEAINVLIGVVSMLIASRLRKRSDSHAAAEQVADAVKMTLDNAPIIWFTAPRVVPPPSNDSN